MLHVKWGREVLHLPMPPLDTPLGALRVELAEYTHLPAGSFKLVYKGGVMKEDSAPLSAYKLKDNAVLALIGGDTGETKTGSGGATMAKAVGKAGVPQTEAAAVVAIRAEVERVREGLVPDVARFVAGLGERGNEGAVDHARLSELLLQSLLRLDALYVPGVEWPEARVERKAAVREVQGVLDRLDGAWAGR